MDLGLKNRVAIVGGASRGLGLACARALAAEGARVVICSRGAAALEAAAREITSATGGDVVSIACDQTRSDDIERLVEATLSRFGGVDILVNNTGGPPAGLFLDHDDATWEGAFQSLLMSVVRLCRAVVPIMRASGWGRIINNTSFAVKEPAELLVLSNALRAAVVATSKTLAREVAGAGVTVNCVAPGAFDTERLHALFAAQAKSTGRSADEVRAEWESRIPIGRLALPEELAAMVAFLSSDRAAAITGACFPVDGGMLHGLF